MASIRCVGQLVESGLMVRLASCNSPGDPPDFIKRILIVRPI
jgi:hypothetical protein